MRLFGEAVARKTGGFHFKPAVGAARRYLLDTKLAMNGDRAFTKRIIASIIAV